MNRLLLLSVGIILSSFSLANNVIINNVTRPANDEISFNISWQNSWFIDFAPNNWDAVWVFIKAQDCDSDQKAWEHVDVSTNSSDHSAASPLQVDAVTDGKGVFIRRAAIGGGDVAPTLITLKFQNSYSATNVNFEVLGIEMVAVLEGSFRIGGTAGSYTTTTSHNAFSNNYNISSESAIAQGAIRTASMPTSTTYYGQYGYNPTIPTDFPKGYNKFYIMKYEISQEQYARFLNLLNFNQQAHRTQNSPGSAAGTNALSSSLTGIVRRSGVRVRTTGSVSTPAVFGCDLNDNNVFDENDDGQNVACNYLKWTDLLAYLDWSALRPMTELEYEKACRGFGPYLVEEYAWGSAGVTATNSASLLNDREPGEISNTTIAANTGLGALAYTTTAGGPLRVGFAATNSSMRLTAGASYWGVMDLTGNVWEQTVSVGYANGNISAFTGVLGDGKNDGNGEADQSGWSLNPIHSVVRGGSFYTPITSNTSNYGKIGSRYYIGNTTYTANRHYETGGRGVRQF